MPCGLYPARRLTVRTKLDPVALSKHLHRGRIGRADQLCKFTEKLLDPRGGRRPRHLQHPGAGIAKAMPGLPRDKHDDPGHHGDRLTF